MLGADTPADKNTPGRVRLALIADSPEALRKQMDRAKTLIETNEKSRFSSGGTVFFADSPDSTPKKLAWLFPGYGAQYSGMLRGIPESFPAADEWIGSQSARAQSYFRNNPWLLGHSESTQKIPPAEQAYSILIADLIYGEILQSLKIPCDGIVGHSYGESAALHCAGIVENPWKAIGLAKRVFASAGELETPCAFLTARGEIASTLVPPLSIALDNCPAQSVLSGAPDDVERIKEILVAKGELVFGMGQLNQPVHTPQFPVNPEQFREVYDAVEFLPPRIPLYSCASGVALPGDAAAMKKILIRQWTETVRLREVTENLYAAGFRIFLEAGPAGRLSGFVRDTLRGRDATIVACDQPNRDTGAQMLETLAKLHCAGIDLNEKTIESNCILYPATNSGPKPAIIAKTKSDPLLTTLLAEMADLLGTTDHPDPSCGFFDSGLGSLETVELASRLSQHLGKKISPVLFFEHTNPEELARSLTEAPAALPASSPRSKKTEAIAIVGMACRLPGGADSPEQLWKLLLSGSDAIGEIPADRWNADDWPDIPRWGGFLTSVTGFDAEFFGMSAREADALDPQQRILLELAWEALEDSLIEPTAVRNSNTAVYTGISGSEYSARLTPQERLQTGGYIATGCMPSVAAGRISNFLGCRGPSLSVDTACSSSLVAVDLAVQALRSGACDRALAGGVNVLLSPELTIHLAQSGALAADGRCKSFDAAADGYVRSEGGGMVVLKRLSDALADGDRIHSVIRGTAVDHNGPASGLTVPSSKAQALLLRKALYNAGVEAEAIGCIEAHGTGTKLGDPIEASALGSVFHARSKPLPIGSIKSQIGHLEAGAGIAGLLKMVLQLSRKTLAPSLHFQNPNPAVDWDSSPLQVCTKETNWTESRHPRFGGVSSFGISGTNAHVILEEPPPSQSDDTPAESSTPEVYPVTAHSTDALAGSVKHHREYLSKTEQPFPSLAWSARNLRKHDVYRRCVWGNNPAEIISALERPGRSRASRNGVVFLFPGQGVTLESLLPIFYETEPTFRATFDDCSREFTKHGFKLSPNPKEMTAASFQAALFSGEVALANLWTSRGIRPVATVGHSLGEFAAATLAEILSLQDACQLVALRSQLMAKQGGCGTMLTVRLSESAVLEIIKENSYPLDIAAVNGPKLVVVSGPKEDVANLRNTLREQKVSCMKLPVAHAFHSRSMNAVADQLKQMTGNLTVNKPSIPFVSGQTGSPAEEIQNSYWAEQLRQPVRFHQSLLTLIEAGYETFLEVGPGNTLCSLGLQASDRAGKLTWIPGPSAGDVQPDQTLQTLCDLYERGESFDWESTTPPQNRRTALPRHFWNRSHHWIASGTDSVKHNPGPTSSTPTQLENPLQPIIDRFFAAKTGRQRRKGADLYVRYLSNGILGNPSEKELAAETRFLTLGFDSMTATLFRLQARKDFGIDISARWIIDEGTPVLASARIVEEAKEKVAATPSSVASQATGKDSRIHSLSIGQRALWYLQKLTPSNTSYNQTLPLRITQGTAEHWEKTCSKLVAQHEILRTRYPEANGEPTCEILPDIVPDFAAIQCSDRKSFHERIAEEHHRPFQLEREVPLRIRWISCPGESPALLLILHHIACDGWSLEILRRDLSTLSQGNTLPPLPSSYEEFTHWQEAMLGSPKGVELRNYWVDSLTPQPPLLTLPTDFPRPLNNEGKGATQAITISPKAAEALRSLAQKLGVTLQNAILATFAILLRQFSGQEDCVVGCPVAGRENSDFTEVVGYFVNPLPIRLAHDTDSSFADCIQAAQKQMQEAIEHQDYPFPLLVQELNASREPGRSPLFDASFNYVRLLSRDSDEVEEFTIDQASGKFDLTLNAVESREKLSLSFAYRSDLFLADTITQFGEHLCDLILGGAAHPSKPLPEILSTQLPKEKLSLIKGKPQPIKTGMMDRIFSWAERTPNQLALRAGEETLTYGQLCEKVCAWASELHRHDIGPGDSVALLATRSAATMAAYFGILASGAALIPLDPETPASTIREILTRTGARLLICENNKREHFPDHKTIAISPAPTRTDTKTPATPALSTPAYILFTSGSTGTPKGVVVSHRSLANYGQSLQEMLQAGPRSHFGHISPLFTDLGNTAWIGSLVAGGCLHLISDSERLHPVEFARYCHNHPLDFLKTTPSHFSALCDSQNPSDCFPSTALILGGERVDSDWIQKLNKARPECSILHHYGPTEATIGVLMAKIESTEKLTTPSLPLRQAVTNTKISIENAEGNLMPRGLVGELVIAGESLAIGYLSDDRSDEGRFTTIPLGNSQQYRTGDLARMSPSGDLVILGRLDRQIKIHGIRIEPGHLETLVKQFEEVDDCCVFVLGEQLAACVVNQGQVNETAIRQHLEKHLPPSQIPTRWFFRRQLPLLRSGKVDTQSFTETPPKKHEENDTSLDPLARSLLTLWSDLLERPDLTPEDDFFEAGGHSLLAVRLVARISADTGHTLSITDLLTHPTVEALTNWLRTRNANTDPRNSAIITLRTGEGPTQVLLPGAGGSLLYFHPLVQHLESSNILGLAGLPENQTHPQTIEELATFYLNQLKEVQLTEPISLIGHSFGGLLAWELARQLVGAGKTIQSLAVIDNPAHGSGAGREYANWNHNDWLQHIALRIGKLNGVQLTLPSTVADESDPDAADRKFAGHLRTQGFLPADTSDRDLAAYVRLYRGNALSAATYEPKPIEDASFRFLLFRARDEDHDLAEDRSGQSEALGWEKLTPAEPQIHSITGTHLTLLNEPNIADLARIWNQAVHPPSSHA